MLFVCYNHQPSLPFCWSTLLSNSDSEFMFLGFGLGIFEGIEVIKSGHVTNLALAAGVLCALLSPSLAHSFVSLIYFSHDCYMKDIAVVLSTMQELCVEFRFLYAILSHLLDRSM